MADLPRNSSTTKPPEEGCCKLIIALIIALLQTSEADCNDPRHRFIPRAALFDLITLSSVERLLRTIPAEDEKDWKFRQRVARAICPSPGECSCTYAHCTGGRMIFSTLVLCGREDLLLSSLFLRTPRTCDEDLPLRVDSLDYLNYVFSGKEKELFIHKQWQVYTPFLKPLDTEQGLEVETFPEEVSLPWAEKERIGQRFPGEVSYVERVEIPPRSHNLTPNDTRVFALKTFEQRLAPNLSKRRFQQEIEANLQAPKHDRIVRLLTAFTHRERSYILFPYANEISLEKLWRSYAPPGVAQDSSEAVIANWYTDDWLVRECLGIASALAAIHGLGDDRPDDMKALLHADIKPENILCFRDPGSAAPVILKLADFGEAKMIDPDVPLKASKVAHVMTYRPPEHSPQNGITLKYDVWCLGCLFLDFVTWAILGQNGVDSFSSIREEEQSGSDQIIEDTFFKRDPGSLFSTKFRLGISKKLKVDHGLSTTKYSLWINSHLKLTPGLKKGVVLQLKSLVHHNRCSEQLRHVLLLVGERMLVVDPERRSDSREVREYLRRLSSSS